MLVTSARKLAPATPSPVLSPHTRMRDASFPSHLAWSCTRAVQARSRSDSLQVAAGLGLSLQFGGVCRVNESTIPRTSFQLVFLLCVPSLPLPNRIAAWPSHSDGNHQHLSHMFYCAKHLERTGSLTVLGDKGCAPFSAKRASKTKLARRPQAAVMAL